MCIIFAVGCCINDFTQTPARYIKEVIHLQVPLQIPCVDLARLAESRFESTKK